VEKFPNFNSVFYFTKIRTEKYIGTLDSKKKRPNYFSIALHTEEFSIKKTVTKYHGTLCSFILLNCVTEKQKGSQGRAKKSPYLREIEIQARVKTDG